MGNQVLHAGKGNSGIRCCVGSRDEDLGLGRKMNRKIRKIAERVGGGERIGE